ncbi:MAG: hypothetical protein ACHQJD_05540 [Thermoanaerobaculia bacterium]
MPSATCESEVASIVLVGRFNPSIFHPSWLAANSLVRQEEAQEAKVGIVHSEVADFSLGWVHIQVTTEKFVSSAEAAHEMALLDLVKGIFALLEHTPTDKMGLNRAMHFRLPSVEAWHAMGHRLAPKAPWSGIVEEPGMLSLVMTGKRPGSLAKSFQAQVGPSQLVQPGIYVATNEHFESPEPEGHGKLMVLLSECWQDAQRYAKTAARKLVDESI